MSDPAHEAGRAAARASRDSYGRLVAFLAARTRDVAGAEDALAEAFAAALETWPKEGVPCSPDAWLLTVARRRQADAARRRQRARDNEPQLVLMAEALEEVPEQIPDRRLALMFACAHPALEPGVRAPLILQTLLGLTAADIAQAFLVPPAAMGQRLVRAKTRIRATGIPLAVPAGEELPARLDAVLAAIYGAYGKAWGEIGAAESASLAGEALWLARLTVSLLPEEPEAHGLLALMLYTESRRAARRGPDGAYVPLGEQDTALWDQSLIAEAEALLREASAGGPCGRFQIEAAIQSAHVAAVRGGASQARALVALYDHLIALTGSPVAALNRAAALAELEGPAAALATLEPLQDTPCLQGYQPWWATRGHLLALAGRMEEAREALTIAIGLTTDEAVRVHLRRKLEGLGQAGVPGLLR